MGSGQGTFDRKHLLLFLLSVPCTVLLFFAIQIVVSRYGFTEHVTIDYYIRLTRIALVLLPLSLLLSAFIPLRPRFDYTTLIERFTPRSFLFLIIAISLIITNLISLLYYDHIPQGDSVVTLFQAKIFAVGRLWATTPAFPDFFLSEMVSRGTKWFSMVQKGHAMWLALFHLLRVSWLLGPLLGASSLAIFFLFVKNSFDGKTAREAAVLLLFSPLFLFTSASYLNQNSSLFFIMLSLLFISLSVKRDHRSLPFLAGVFAGFAFLSRSTVTVFIPGFLLVLGCSPRHRIQALLLFLAGFLPTCSLQLMLNALYTGHPLRFAYSLHLHPYLHAIGFGVEKGMPTYGINGHTPLKALINLCYNGFAFSLHLFGWPLLSLMFIPLAFRRWKRDLWELFSAIVIGCSIIFFSLYWFHGISPMGPKYYFEICPLLVLLTVRGMRKTDMRALAGILICINILIYIPCALQPFNRYWGTNNHCYNEVRRLNLQNALVFIKDLPGDTEYERTLNRHNYLSVAFRNHPFVEKGSIIYAKSLGDDRNRQCIRAYGGRDAFLFEYTGGISEYHLVPYLPESYLPGR
jgi:hypothetical protein